MNTLDHVGFDPRIADWLDGDPNEAPDQALEVILAAFPSIPQRHPTRRSWSSPGIAGAARVGLGVAAVLTVIVGGLFAVGPPVVGPGASASPSITPPASLSPPPDAGVPVDTTDWVAFSSDRHGFEMSYPPLWKAEPATSDWTLADAYSPGRTPGRGRGSFTSATDRFSTNMEALYLTAFSAPLPAGVSEDAWIGAYLEAVDPAADCAGPLPEQEDVEVDGRPARLIHHCHDTHAIVFSGDRVQVFAEWRGSNGPLLKAFLSTVRFGPNGGVLPASGPVEFGTYTIERERWGGRPIGGQVSITIPAGWTSDGGAALVKSGGDSSDQIRLSLGTMAGVFADPCDRSKGLLPEGEHSHMQGEAEALANQVGRIGPPPVSVPIAAWHGFRVELTTPGEVAPCDGGEYRSWATPDRPAGVSQRPGQIDLLWLVDTDREMFYIDAALLPTTSDEDRAEILRIVESIRFVW